MMELWETKKEVLLYAFFTAFLAGIFVYGFELTHFTLSIDEEVRNNTVHTIAGGRWADAIVYCFLDKPFVPFFTTFVSITLIACSPAVMVVYLQLNRLRAVMFSLLFIGIPEFAYQLEFSQQAITVSLGCLLATLSVYPFFASPGRKKWPWVLAVLLCTFAIGIYQPIVLIAPSVFFALHLGRKESLPAFIAEMGRFLVFIVLSVVLYAVIAKGFMAYYRVNDSAYFTNTILWMNQPFGQTVKQATENVLAYFNGKAPYGLNVYGFCVIPFIVMIFRLAYSRNFSGIVSLIALFCLLFTFLVTNPGMPQFARVQLNLSLVFAVLFVGLFSLRKSCWAGIVAAVCITITGSESASQLFYSDYLRERQDTVFATRVIADIYRIYPEASAGGQRVWFYGSPMLPAPLPLRGKTDSFNDSFFNMFGGNSRRIIHYLNYTGYANFEEVSVSAADKLNHYAEGLPVYPVSGSISKVDGVIVVRLGKTVGW